jgi:hypothetical protein
MDFHKILMYVFVFNQFLRDTKLISGFFFWLAGGRPIAGEPVLGNTTE